MKGKASRKLLCLLLVGLMTSESIEMSSVSAAEESASQESFTDNNDQEDWEKETYTDDASTESEFTEADTGTEESSEQETESFEEQPTETEESSEQETESSEEQPTETEESSEQETGSSEEQPTETEESSEQETESSEEQPTETSPDEEETEEITETTDIVNEEVVDEYEEHSFIYINPLYKDVITADELTAQLEQGYAISFYAARESSSFSSLDEAAAYLREQMVERNTTVSFQVPVSIAGDTEENIKNFQENVLAAATAHTEDCKGWEGDALAWTYGGAGVSYNYNSETCNITYTISYYTTAEQEQELTAKVNEAMAGLNLSGKSDYEKVKAIHDYICNNVDYDYENLSNDANKTKFTAYGALCTGKAVCQGYATAFYRMCKEAGLSVRVITGTGNGGAHAWNIVRIGNATRAAGEYYNIDCTWDGQDTETHYTYFLLNEADFENHTRDAKYNTADFHNQYPMSASSYVDTDSYETGLNQANPNVTFTTLNDTTVSSAADGKPKLIVFFRTTCANSQSTIKAIAGHTFPGIDLYAAEIDGAGKDSVSSFKATYGSDDIVFSYGGDNNLSLFQYAQAGGLTDGNSMSVALPVLCYIDANNKLQYITQGVQNASQIETNLNYYCSTPSTGEYTITYELDGGTNSISNPSSYTSASNTIVLANPTKSGYTFGGWYRDAAFTQKVTQITQGTSGNIVLYAKWTANAASDKLNLDNPDCELLTINDEYISTSAEGNPKLLIFFSVNCGKSQQTIRELSQQELSNVDIYAIDVIQSSKVEVTNFKNQYGAGKDFITYSYDEYYLNNSTLNNYLDAANHEDAAPPIICYIDADNKLQHITNGYSSVNTIKANLEAYCLASEPAPAVTYTITYELDGGRNHDANPGTYSAESGNIVLQAPTREGYTFAGWYTDSNLTNQITQITTGNTGNLILYAKWESNTQNPPTDPTPGDDNNGNDDNNNNTGNNSNNGNGNNSNNNSGNNTSSTSTSANNNATTAANSSNPNPITTLNWVQIQESVHNTISQQLLNPVTDFVSMDFVSAGEVNVPVNILSEIQGKNAIIAFHNGHDAAMSINGVNLTDLDLSEFDNVNLTIISDTDFIPETALAAKTLTTLAMRQISVISAGPIMIPVQMHIKVNEAYTGQFANLYCYNPQSGALEYMHSCPVISGGHTVFPVAKGGNYLLTVTAQMPEAETVIAQIPEVSTDRLPDNESQYTIKPGDTLSAVARTHQMSLTDLLSINPQITDINKIQVNQVINIKN